MSCTLNASTLQIGGVTLADSSAFTIPANQRKSYTPITTNGTSATVSSVPYAFYLDLGAVKICWGQVIINITAAVNQTGTLSVSPPSGLFTVIHSCQLTLGYGFGVTSVVVTGQASTTSQLKFQILSPNTTMNSSTVCQVHFLCFGA
jgi:hypothetical protein